MEVERGAIFSDDGKFRYVLMRDWSITPLPIALCIGLNPSTANGHEDDPTIRILIKTLNNLGFGGLRMLNLYSFITPKPEKLWETPDAIGDTDKWLRKISEETNEIIFCWGAFRQGVWRAKRIKEIFPSAKCFGKNKDGSPLHPMAIMWQGIKTPQLIQY